MQFFGKECANMNKAAENVSKILIQKIDKILNSGIQEELLDQNEQNELNSVINKLSKNPHKGELVEFGNILQEINDFWKTYLPKFAALKIDLEKGLLLKNPRFYIQVTAIVGNAISLFNKIKNNIDEEERKSDKFALWDRTIGEPALTDIGYTDETDTTAYAAIDLIHALENHAERLKKLVDLTFAELKDLEISINEAIQTSNA